MTHVVHLELAAGIDHWVSWSPRRGVLEHWVRVDGRPAVPLPLPLGLVLCELGVSATAVDQEMAAHRYRTASGPIGQDEMMHDLAKCRERTQRGR